MHTNCYHITGYGRLVEGPYDRGTTVFPTDYSKSSPPLKLINYTYRLFEAMLSLLKLCSGSRVIASWVWRSGLGSQSCHTNEGENGPFATWLYDFKKMDNLTLGLSKCEKHFPMQSMKVSTFRLSVFQGLYFMHKWRIWINIEYTPAKEQRLNNMMGNESAGELRCRRIFEICIKRCCEC